MSVRGFLIVASAFLAGGGSSERMDQPPKPTPNVSEASTVTAASVGLSVVTHHGAESLSGLLVAGRCTGHRVRVVVGRHPPYAPLRTSPSPAIDKIRLVRRAALSASCQAHQFHIVARVLQLRSGRGPLTARGTAGTAVAVAIHTHGIE